MTDPIIQGLDPRLASLGELIGLLDPASQGDDLYTLHTAWFKNPITPIQSIPTERRPELLDFIVSFLGQPETGGLAGSDGQTWYPIEYQQNGTTVTTGLSLITYGLASADPCPLALGAKHEYSTASLQATLLMELPLLDLASGTFPLAHGDSQPVCVALQLRGSGGAAFTHDTVSLSGLDLTAKLYLTKAPEIDLLLRDFSIAGAAPKDLSLIELAKDPGALVGVLLKSFITAALKAATDAAISGKTDPEKAKIQAMESDLLWLLGLTTGSGIPEVQWADLPKGFGKVWTGWFDSILSNTATLKAWLHGIYCLFQGFDAAQRKDKLDADLGGAGTAADPFAVSIFAVAGSQFKLTLSVDNAAGVSKFTPGIMLSSAPIPASGDIGIRLTATASVGGMSISANSFHATLLPAATLSAIVEQKSKAPLFVYTSQKPEDAISPNLFSAGIRFGGDGGQKLAPFADFEQTGVKRLALIDLLTNAKAITDPTGWLLEKLQDPDLWNQLLTQALPADSGITYQDGGLEFSATPADGSKIGVRAAIFESKGISLNLAAGAAIDWLTLSMNAGLTLADVTHPGAPALTFEATMGGDAASTTTPTLKAGFSDGVFLLAVELPIPNSTETITLSLVPFKALDAFSIDKIWPMLEGAVLGNAAVKTWLDTSLQGVPNCSVGSILTDWELFEKQGGTYRFVRTGSDIDFAKLKKLSPVDLIKAAMTQFLASVDEFQLLKIADGQGVYLIHDKTANRYGIRVAVSGLLLSGGGSGGGDAGSTKVTFQAGKWMELETAADNWLQKAWTPNAPPQAQPPNPGIHVDLLTVNAGTAKFSPGLKLVSVGVDVEGTAKNPLFDIKGYRAEGIQTRLYLDASGGSSVQLGAGVRLDRASIPLGPGTGGDSGSKNPVASGLLSSGSAPGSDTANAPVNPVFGVQIAYAKRFSGAILGTDPKAGGKVWIPVEKSFGPLYCRKVGLGFDDHRRLLVGYDGSVALGPLGIDLMDLAVGIPLATPQTFSEYSLDLGGLNLSFNGGPIAISGSFLESRTGQGAVQYTGAAMIQATGFSISGIGSYTTIGGSPSLFVFAVLNKDLGGPAFFFVTALAAGFGFKRKLILPSIEGVLDFPLVRVIREPDYIGQSADPTADFEKINAAIPPDPSSYWLAVGVRFLSFGQINTVALLSVSFGADFSIAVLGVSTITVPSNLPAGQPPICYAELALRAEFHPSAGVLSVEARLTSNSYIFEKDCKLTGGFAFYTWFSGPHEGDFVVTLGGYHPRFLPPSHYPVVPRVGIDWRVNGNLRITGELYFALTPSCLMAGGKLSAVYDAGWLRAWFIAYADFLVSWKPFHYDIQIGVSLGASATVSIDLGLFTISISISFELGVDLHIWGPKFAGTARIKFYVVSFTLSFGDTSPAPPPLLWPEFATTFLPEPSSVCGVAFTGGLLREYKKGAETVAIVNGPDFAFTVQSQAPCTGIAWNGDQTLPEGSDPSKALLGVAPMYTSGLKSTLQATVTRNGTPAQKLDSSIFKTTLIRKGFPQALWGSGKPDLSQPSAKVLPNVPAGIQIELSEAGKRSQIRHSAPAMQIQFFAYEVIPKRIAWATVPLPDTIIAPGTHTLANTLCDPDVSKIRAGILGVLAAATPYPLNVVDQSSLTGTATQAASIFQSAPTYAALGQLLP